MKAPAFFRFLGLLLVILTFFRSFSLVRANSEVFLDDFLTIRDSVWNLNLNITGVIDLQENSLHLHSPESKHFPYVVYYGSTIPSTDYSISLRFKFSGSHTYGNGIIFSDNLIPNNTTVDIRSSDVIFQIWPTGATTYGLWTTVCPKNLTNCVDGSYSFIASLPEESWHTVDIRQLPDTSFIVNSGTTTFQTRPTNRSISKIWLGNPQYTNTPTFQSDIFLDFLRIFDESQPKITPVIILPGFGGSWDVGAILAGTAGTHWEIPSFIKNYNGIQESFIKAGYEGGKDLFVFPYDWRKPLSDLADDLKTFIDSKNLLNKVDLVGHSMGGLVARAYAQKYGMDKVDKILTAGSPHLGLVDTYGLWEGAKTWDDVWWQKVLLETATEVNRRDGETKVAAVRRISPSIIDLFPTFPFLLLEGNIQGIDSMVQRNGYLKSLNLDISILGDKLTPFWSDDITTTKRNINAVTRSDEDAVKQRWEDGSPVGGDPFVKASGDGSVTKESAVGPFGIGEKLTGWHSDLLSSKDNIGKIFGKLGLDPIFATSVETDHRKNSFVAILRSPGTLEVCNSPLTLCDDQLGGMYFPESKLFILPGYNQEDLVVRVKEAGLGDYKLHLGNIDESPDWVVQNGTLNNLGQTDTYDVRSDQENIFIVQDNVITFDPLEDKTFGDADFTIQASASSDLPVSFTSAGVCNISGTTIHIVGAGICTIIAHQAGNAYFNLAPDVSRSFNIGKAEAVIETIPFSGIYDGFSHAASGIATGLAGQDLKSSLDLGNSFSQVPGGTAHWTFNGGSNYNDQSGDIRIEINKAMLHITAENQSQAYSDPREPFTYLITGYVNNENEVSGGVTGSPYCLTTRTRLNPIGEYPINCSTGTLVSGNYDFTYSPGSFTVTKENTTIEYAGDLFVMTGGPLIKTAPVLLSAKLAQDSDGYPGDLSLAQVTFELIPAVGNSLFIRNIPVNSAGEAVTTYNVPEGVYEISVMISEDNKYWTQNSLGKGSLTVALGGNNQRVTGGGWIYNSLNIGTKGNFGFTVNYNKTGAPKGNFVFIFSGDDGYYYQLKSNSWTKGGLSFTTSSTALFTAKATISKIDRITGLTEVLGGDYTFVVKIKDGELSKSKDTFFISIFDASNNPWRQFGIADLGGGNIVIHSK